MNNNQLTKKSSESSLSSKNIFNRIMSSSKPKSNPYIEKTNNLKNNPLLGKQLFQNNPKLKPEIIIKPLKKVEDVEECIKIKTTIESNYLFHYAHFICDFIFPLICGKNERYNEIIRIKNLNQTIGNFDKMCSEIIGKNYKEIPEQEYRYLKSKEIELPVKEKLSINDYKYFQNYMWNKFIEKESNKKWPEVILIRRKKQNIINIEDFETDKFTFRSCNGSQRRDMHKIDEISDYLKLRYKDRFQEISLENTTIGYQVNLFYNAKMIVASHGAALINNFYCKPGTIIVESIALPWYFFDTISKNLNLKHYKCENHKEQIIKVIEKIKI